MSKEPVRNTFLPLCRSLICLLTFVSHFCSNCHLELSIRDFSVALSQLTLCHPPVMRDGCGGGKQSFLIYLFIDLFLAVCLSGGPHPLARPSLARNFVVINCQSRGEVGIGLRPIRFSWRGSRCVGLPCLVAEVASKHSVIIVPRRLSFFLPPN